MTEDFARDMRLLKDLLELAQTTGQGGNPAVGELEDLRSDLELQAHNLMIAVSDLKLTFNVNNRALMMGLWIAGFEDPVDPYKVLPEVNDCATEADLIANAKIVGNQLIVLMDKMKHPHVVFNDPLGGGTAVAKIDGVRTIPDVNNELKNGSKWLGDRLDSLTADFKGGAGGPPTYWPSNYVSSSSSSSSSSSYP